ncbi:MAG: InlB B-repeat-containing protein [Oscillospiraceae bacterium]
MKKRLVASLLVLIMVLGMLPVSAFAADDGVSPQALDTGHKIDVTFTVLYVGDEFRIGYNYGTSEKTQFVCQYSTPHSDTAYNNHTIAISDIKAAADRATVNSGYQIVGWSKEANANPTVWPLNKSGDTACNKGTTIYLVAKNPNPEVTYTLTYYPNTTDLVTNMPSPNPVTQKSSTSPVTFTVSSAIPAREGYNFLGWNGKPDATTPTVQPGNWVTTPATTTRLYAVWQSNTPPTDKPAKPTENDVTGVVVDIVCVTTTGTHDTVQYPLGHPTDAQHTIGEVVSDGAGGYICPVTVRTAWFVQQASNLVWKVQHTPTAQTITFNLTYDKNSKTWVKPAANPRIEATHEVTPDTPGDQKPNIEEANAKIRVQCIEYPSKHNPYTKNYRILPGSYDDLGWDRTEYGYIYSIRLNRAKYIAQFDQEIGRPHTDTEQNKETRINWRWENGAWHLIDGPDGVTADIKVKCAETPVKPEKPTALDGSFAIVCKNNKATHPYKADYIATPSQYTISDVQMDDQGYYVTATVTVAPNLVAYNTATRAEHRLVNEQDATLTITFRYDTEAAGDGNRKWKQQGDLPVVEVICKEIEAPTADELKKLDMAVQVKCVVDAAQQHTSAYGLLGEYDKDYFVGEPKKVGDDWLCDISYDPDPYVAEFNKAFPTPKHIQNDEKIVPVTLIWAGGSWQIKTQGRVHVTEEYTVTYTDGVDGEEVFADQVYSDLRKDSTTPAFNGTPTRTGYTFAGWDPEVAETVTETVTYAAKWTPVEPTHDDIFKALNGLVTVTCINRFWKDGNKNMDCGQGQYAAKAGIAGQDYTLVKGENAGTWVVTFPVTNFVKSFKQDPAHNLYTKDTLSWYIRWEDNAWTSEPVESGVDDLVKLTHAPTDWREVAKIATGGKSDCIHTSCVNGETGVCDYGITVPFVYFNTDVVSVEPEDGVPGSYIATFKVDRYIDTCAKACNDKNFPDAPRTHKLLTQETVQWRLYATPEADEKIGNNVLNHVWEAEPVEAGKDDVCTIAHNWVVTFDPANGGDTFTQDVEYEGKATEPAAPEKTGYTFDGWYLGEAEEPFDFDTIITSDITLTAKWHVTPHNIYAYARLNSYFAPLTTSEFDTPVTLNEATLSRLGLGSYNSLGYISIGSFTFDAVPLTDDQYFGDDAELSAVAEKLATDIALETGVSDKIAEKIAWMALYKTVNEEDMAPGYPAEAGYQLSGNLDLATVMFKANGENVTGMPAVNYTYDDILEIHDFYFTGDTFTLPADPTREGYIFEGWSVKVLPAENDADHLDADGADDAADETLLKAGDTYTITAGGVVFTAQWEARTDTPYTVEHYLENLDGSYALDTTEPLKGTTDTTVTAAAKSYDNFTYDSTVPGTVASGNIAGDGSLVLKLFYTRNTYDYTVRHIKQLPDGTYDEANAEVENLSGKFEALAAVTAKDYGSHYPTNDADTKQNIKIEKNLTIDVKYDLDEHTLTFETNGGSAINPVTVRHGNAVARPADPTKDKYTFIGWYADPEFTEEYDFATVLEADKTIYAKFELTSTPIGDIYVRYDVLHIKQLPDGTYDLANAEVEHLSAKKDTTVTAVIKDYRATHHVNVNRTLSKLTGTAIQPYRGVDGKPVYTILSVYYDLDFHTLTFDTMGGSKIAPETVRHGLTVAKPKDPVNGGYIFDGWYTDKTFRHRYDFSTPLTEDITIYAKWFLIVLPGVTVKKNTPKLNTADHFAYVQGYPDGTVKPAGNITRAETAAILFRLMDDASRKTYYSTKSGFRDVASGSWYNTYVATLNNAGVITDSSNGCFRPNEAITRAELAAMLAKFSETTGAANYFNDVSAKYWAANAIAICAKLGWINGYPDGTFRPDKNVTRAELMAMINRATGRAPKSADAFLPGMKTWIDNTSDKWYYLDVQEATNSHSYTVKGSETWTALTSDPNWSLYE